MRALALHPDVIVVEGSLYATNTVVLRAGAAAGSDAGPLRVIEPGEEEASEVFVIDSPVLPDELASLGSLLEQARFRQPDALLATHGDWDHLLAVQAFPGLSIGVAESTARRLAASPEQALRELERFDAGLYLRREPLQLPDLQSLPVPGRLDLGELELELHRADGHTEDGMAIFAPWAGVLICGDYLSPIEIPLIGQGGSIGAYSATLDRLDGLLARSRYAVPGHGRVLEAQEAKRILLEDRAYLEALAREGSDAPLPAGRDGELCRGDHAANAATL